MNFIKSILTLIKKTKEEPKPKTENEIKFGLLTEEAKQFYDRRLFLMADNTLQQMTEMFKNYKYIDNRNKFEKFFNINRHKIESVYIGPPRELNTRQVSFRKLEL